jgi:predicted dehydrogenase
VRHRAGERLRLAILGAGTIVPVHVRAFERIGRTALVAVASRSLERASAVTSLHGGRPFDDVTAMLDTVRPDVLLIATPPDRTPELCRLAVERGLPFLVEKPLAATEPAGLESIADAIERSRLVVAVGYHLRGLEALPDVRERLLARPPALIVGRWYGGTVGGEWWGRVERSGGQIVEQATHLLDLARVLAGDGHVVGAAALPPHSDRGGTRRDDADAAAANVAAATAAVVRFDSGAVGAFAATRVVASARVGLEIASDGLTVTVRREPGDELGRWVVTVDEGTGERVLRASRGPYEIQDAAFVRAVETNDPAAVLCTYRDAIATDRLARAVVAATGTRG